MLRLSIAKTLCPLATVALIASGRYWGGQSKPRSFVALNVTHCEPRLPKVDLTLPKCEHSHVDEVTMPDGAKYVGTLQDGKRWGKGESWDKLGHYTGSWVDNVKCGMGVFKYHNGNVYEGLFDSDLPNGYGKMTLRNGEVLEGVFVNGALQGQPILSFPWGRYEGQVLNGLPHGYGRKIYDDGDLMEGYFCEGKASGQARYIDSRGWVREGEYGNDQLVSGRVLYKDEFVWEGSLIDGEWNGQVRMSFPDGCCEEGWYEAGVLHGCKRVTYSDGAVVEKNFVKGVAHGMERIVYPKGSVWETEYVDGVPLQTCTHTDTFPDGDVVIATMVKATSTTDWLRHGPITIRRPNGEVVTGLIKCGEMYGRWKITYPDGRVTVGDFPPRLMDRVLLWEKELRLIHWPKVRAALNNGKSD